MLWTPRTCRAERHHTVELTGAALPLSPGSSTGYNSIQAAWRAVRGRLGYHWPPQFPPGVALVELGRCGSPDFVTSLSIRSPVCRVDNKSIPPSLGPYGDIAQPGTVTVTIGVIGVIEAGGGGSPSRRWISRRCSR